MKRSCAIHKATVAISFVFIIVSCSPTKTPTVIKKTDTRRDSAILSRPKQDTTKEKEETAIKRKYGKILNISPESIKNMKLFFFIDEWLGTPYKWGGDTKKGIDCSAFIQRLLKDVYNISIPRTSALQFFNKNIEQFRSKGEDVLKEGDLVFFSTDREKPISHVGLYLANRMFVNSASSKGVSIASIDNNYWNFYYKASGRVRVIVKDKSKKEIAKAP